MLPCNYNSLSSPCLKSHAHNCKSLRARAGKQTRLDARKTPRAHKQAGVHAHEQAWITLELFEEWGMKPISPTHLSPPELFYSYQRISGHQLFTSVKGGTQRNTELQPESEREPTDRQTDRGKQPVQITKEFISQSAILRCPSVNLPAVQRAQAGASLSDSGCLLDVPGALNNVSAGRISPHDVSLMLSFPPYLPQIEADCQEMKGQQWGWR